MTHRNGGGVCHGNLGAGILIVTFLARLALVPLGVRIARAAALSKMAAGVGLYFGAVRTSAFRRGARRLNTASSELRSRVADRIDAWRVIAEHTAETERAVVVFGRRASLPVVLKVIKDSGDEWRSGDVLKAFDGRGVVRVYESVEGAMLLERLSPGRSLIALTVGGSDGEATKVLAETIRAMSQPLPVDPVTTVKDWGAAFDWYAASGNAQIPNELFSTARRAHSRLCSSQGRVRLLHGDLHHANVLFDDERGWLAIDPKGVIGEVEYEVGAALRNPHEWPLFAESSVVRSRLDVFAGELDLDPLRVLLWAFSQAVLSVIWALQDGLPIDWGHSCIALAKAILPMVDV